MIEEDNIERDFLCVHTRACCDLLFASVTMCFAILNPSKSETITI
jgi:hypothetical protein